MNFLAHLYLSPPTADALLGSVLGDFVKGPLSSEAVNANYNAEIVRGIELHRKIDAFTDRHPHVRRSVSRVSSARRRYAGIMIDLFYDHFLANTWHEYHQQHLSNFANDVYRLLEAHSSRFPQRLQRMLPYMIQENWLCEYADTDTVSSALNRISRRFPRNNPLMGAVDELLGDYAAFEQDFKLFMPEVIRFAQSAGQNT